MDQEKKQITKCLDKNEEEEENGKDKNLRRHSLRNMKEDEVNNIEKAEKETANENKTTNKQHEKRDIQQPKKVIESATINTKQKPPMKIKQQTNNMRREIFNNQRK